MDDARIGKHIILRLEAKKVDKACNKLLLSLIIESFTYELKQA